MPINGIETAIYGAEDVARTTQFFVDCGLPLLKSNGKESHFVLDEGSAVIVRSLADATVPKAGYEGSGVKETIFGVDTQVNLDLLAKDVASDREVRRAPDGAVHFLSDCGIALGLRVFHPTPVIQAPDPINAPGNVNRLNVNRKWRKQPRPKVIYHIVYQVKDYKASFAFFRDRLNFRLSDHQVGLGLYARADGRFEHHTVALFDCKYPGLLGRPAFHHIAFGLEDVDEIMMGSNYLRRRGWEYGPLAIGRHRIGSSLFSYFKIPDGGEMEYIADTDYLDDSWIPREWNALFGTAIWLEPVPPYMKVEPPWEVKFFGNEFPARKVKR